MRKIIPIFLALILSSHVFADEYLGPYEKYFIISLGDLYSVCESLKNLAHPIQTSTSNLTHVLHIFPA